MSHPDPLFDPEDDFELPSDDSNDFYLEDSDEDEEEEDYGAWDGSDMDYMDGDFDSAMRDAGWGTDEDYGYYGEDY